MGPTETLARFIAGASYSGLPGEVAAEAKRLILDTLGCALGGRFTRRSQAGLKLAGRSGGSPQATILGARDKTSVTTAAYVNSSMGNTLDYDETYLNFGHYGCPVVFAALAVGESVGASGRDFITAVATGYDITARLANSTGYLSSKVKDGTLTRRPVSGLAYQTVGAAAGAARLLGLDAQAAAETLGLAAHFGPSPTLAKWASQPERLPQIKYGDTGWLALGGAMAALLVREGYDAYPTILDGDDGFWRMYGGDECDFHLMCRSLGEEWWVMQASYKPWPTCRYTHHALTALQKLLGSGAFRREDIEKIAVRGGFTWLPMFAYPHPATIENAQFSLPYAVSMLVSGIEPGPLWHSAEARQDPRLKALREKVSLESTPEFLEKFKEQLTIGVPRFVREVPLAVTVTAGGTDFSESTKFALGDPPAWAPAEFAMSNRALERKFRANASVLAPESKSWQSRVDKVISTVSSLETLADINELTGLLSP